MERAAIKLGTLCEKLGRTLVAFEFGSIVNNPCPVGLVVLRTKATDKEKGEFIEAVLPSRAFIRARGRNGGGHGTVEVVTVDRLRPRRQAQRKEYEDRD